MNVHPLRYNLCSTWNGVNHSHYRQIFYVQHRRSHHTWKLISYKLSFFHMKHYTRLIYSTEMSRLYNTYIHSSRIWEKSRSSTKPTLEVHFPKLHARYIAHPNHHYRDNTQFPFRVRNTDVHSNGPIMQTTFNNSFIALPAVQHTNIPIYIHSHIYINLTYITRKVA